MTENEQQGYREVVAEEIAMLNDGQRLRVTGILLDQRESILVVGDRTGEVEVIYEISTEFENQKVIRVFGAAHNGQIIAERVIPLNLDFDLFVKMHKFEKELKKPD